MIKYLVIAAFSYLMAIFFGADINILDWSLFGKIIFVIIVTFLYLVDEECI